MTKICQECPKYAVFGKQWKKPLVCKKHAKRGYTDVMNKKCIKCDTRASYNVLGEKSPLTCYKHKEVGFIQMTIKRCNECEKPARYAKRGSKTPEKCLDHKFSDHVDVRSKKCSENGCYHSPIYGIRDTRKPIKCFEHKEDHHVDVLHRKCSNEFCDNIYHVDVTNRICSTKNCNTRSTYGEKGTTLSLKCESHKFSNHVDVINPRCLSIGCRIFEKHDRPMAIKCLPGTNKKVLCANCFRNKYPHLDKRKTVRKEHFVLAEIQRQIPELDEYFLVWDCKIPGQSCITDAPDMAWIINDTLLHIEIDERGPKHEQSLIRISSIHGATDCKDHVCIRFNPDKVNEKPSCFIEVNSDKGLIWSRHKTEWSLRMDVLVSEVKSAFEDALSKNSKCGIRKLFFN